MTDVALVPSCSEPRLVVRPQIRRSVLPMLVSGYVAAYAGWSFSSVGSPNFRGVVDDLLLILPGIASTGFAWRASRRAAGTGAGTAWRWVVAANVAFTATFSADLWYQVTVGSPPFPSIADACYLASYPLFLIGLLRFAKGTESQAGQLRLLTDAVTVALAGAAAIWFFVLGPTVSDGDFKLTSLIAGAYPVGDLLELFALAYVLTRALRPSTRSSLLLLTAGTILGVVGDVTMGWLTLHSDFDLQRVAHLAFVGAWAFFVLAGAAQRPIGEVPSEWRIRAGALPYLAPAAVFALVLFAQFTGSFFDRLSLIILGGVTSLLVLLRQMFARHDLRSAQLELERQATHDALTGLPNRAFVIDEANRLLGQGREAQPRVAALFLDLDGFKCVNDTYGHAIGDTVLREVATRLRAAVRRTDVVGRLGGDEFVILLENANAADVERIGETLLCAVRAPIDVDGSRSISLTASIGIAHGSHADAEVLLHAADLALYKAKRVGKDRRVYFDSEMQTSAEERATLELDLRNAIERQEFTLVYQPTFDLRSEEVVGAEALIRWRHPTRGLLLPGRFIPIAEQSGTIIPLGRWVLASACAQAAEWASAGRPLRIAVNVSASQLDREEMVEEIAAVLEASGLAPEMLTLELTETALMRSPGAAASRLAAIKELGVRIALDDFGVGYSTFAYLRDFPLDALKIDRSFVQESGCSVEAAALLRMLVQLGQTMGLETYGEGIEEKGQLAALQAAKCDMGQGFLLAQPLVEAELEAFLDLQLPLGIEANDSREAAASR